MTKISDLWHKLVAAIKGEAQEIDDLLEPIEQELLKGATALIHQTLNTIGKQGVEAIKHGLSEALKNLSDGEHVGDAIKKVVPGVVDQVEEDLKDDARNASYGIAAIVLASLSHEQSLTDGDAASQAPAEEPANNPE